MMRLESDEQLLLLLRLVPEAHRAACNASPRDSRRLLGPACLLLTAIINIGGVRQTQYNNSADAPSRSTLDRKAVSRLVIAVIALILRIIIFCQFS